MDDTLATLAVEFVADTKRLLTGIDDAVKGAKAGGDKAGAEFARALRSAALRSAPGGNLAASLLGTGDMVRLGVGAGVLAGLTATVRMASEAASGLEKYQRVLVGVTGDAGKAKDALRGLQDVAANSNYSTESVLKRGTAEAGRRGTTEGVAERIQKQVDAAAVLGVSPEKFDAFSAALVRLESRTGSTVGKGFLPKFANLAPGFDAQAARTLGVSPDQLVERVAGMTGKKLESVIEQIGEANKGAALRAAMSTPQGAADQIQKEFTAGLAPTGDLLNKMALPVLGVTRDLAEMGTIANRWSHGAAGMVVVLGAVGLAGRLTGPPIMAFIGGLQSATAALVALAAATETATVAESVKTVEETAGGIAGGAGGAAKGAGFLSRIAPFAGFLGLPGLALAGSAGARIVGRQAINDSQMPEWAKLASKTALNFALGGGLPGVFGGIAGEHGAASGRLVMGTDDNTAQRTMKATEKTADAVEKLSAKAYGGGKEVKGALNAAEREYAVYHLMRGNGAGLI